MRFSSPSPLGAARALFSALICFVLSAAAVPDVVPADRNLVQEVALDPSQPCFVATHPRVTTTLRFPAPIDAPEGRGFIEDEKKQVGEYLVSWSPGDSHITLSPLPGAGPLNLNIPFKGTTFVFYFYPVEHQFQAIACLSLRDPARRQSSGAFTAAEEPPAIKRLPGPPPAREILPLTPARLTGFLDRLKLLSAARNTPELLMQAGTMRLEIRSALSAPAAGPSQTSASSQNWHERDSGLFSLRLLLLAIDRRLDCVGFVVEVVNRSSQALAFNPNGFAARVGPRFLPAVLSEAPDILAPGDRRTGCFAVRLPDNLPVDLDNLWGISLELIAPRTNPGAALGQGFARRTTPASAPSSPSP